MTDTFAVTLDQQEDFRFLVDFHQDGVPPLLLDEPEPLGAGAGPNAAHVLAAAVGNCLSASALFCLRRAHVDVHDLHTTVRVTTDRNEAGRMRIAAMEVHLEPVVGAEDQPRMRRCLELFEDFCVVTQSVRAGIDVAVTVEPRAEPRAA
ncbi:MAG TPA: OsmC family protein [Baekduia sp.]|nr:OsmC family protein [Baekduia sp.]